MISTQKKLTRKFIKLIHLTKKIFIFELEWLLGI